MFEDIKILIEYLHHKDINLAIEIIEKSNLSNYQKALLYSEIWLYDKSNELLGNDFLDIVERGRNYNGMHHFQKTVDLLLPYENVDDFMCKNALGVALYYIGEKEKSFQLFLQLLNYNVPLETIRQLKAQLSTHYFEVNEFKKACEYLHMNDRSDFKNPYWNGIIQPGKQIILGYNGGIGDQLVCARFYKHFDDLGMFPIIHTEKDDLCELFNNNGYKTTVDISEYDCPIVNIRDNVCDIPHKLDLDYDDVWYGPYLKPSSEAISKFKDCQGIGLKISGNTKFLFNDTRLIDLDKIIKAIKAVYPNKQIYSMHVDEVIDHPDVKTVNLSSIDDTMGLIHNMDMVISSCTSTAHMAGSMGKKLFVFSAINPFYTWVKHNGKMVWYDDDLTYVHYQTVFADWDYSLIEKELHAF